MKYFLSVNRFVLKGWLLHLLAHVQTIALAQSIPLFKKQMIQAVKYAFEHFAINREKMAINVVFLPRVAFVCSNFMHKVPCSFYYHLIINHILASDWWATYVIPCTCAEP